MEIKPIRTEKDYKQILERIDNLIDSVPGTEEFDVLEVLSILAENYESEHYKIAPPDPIEALKCIMEWKGLTEEDLGSYIGTKAGVSEILNRRKQLSLDMIMKLKRGLGISADILVPETDEEVPIAV